MDKTAAAQEYITKLILEERLRQDEKWGADRDQDNFMWQVILTEEVGEAAESVLKDDTDNLRKELVQCAAVIFAWLENIDRRSGLGWNEGGRTSRALDGATYCPSLVHFFVEGSCARCGFPEPPRQ